MVVLGLLLIKTIYFQIESNISISFLSSATSHFYCALHRSFSPQHHLKVSYLQMGGEAVCHLISAASILFIFWERIYRSTEREIGGLITLIIMCGCDLLNCKVHLNPPANYGMLCGSVSSGAVKIGLSRRVNCKIWSLFNADSVIYGSTLLAFHQINTIGF